MSSRKPFTSITVLLLAAVVVCTPALAEDVEKKFRIGFSVGGWNSVDKVESDAANGLTLVDELFVPQERFIDPRSDSAVFGDLDITSGFIATAHGQYALSKVFIVETSVGYQKTDVGDVEVQGQFDLDLPITQDFDFRVFRIPVGELERIPIQVTALARFRPRASFNPYVGFGIGYMIIGFEPDEAFNALSRNMDASIGAQAKVSSAFFGDPDLIPANDADFADLAGATVEARDTFMWHVATGGELSLKRNWALVVDLRFAIASRNVEIGFNGGKDLGVAVPNLIDFEDTTAVNIEGGSLNGPIEISQGGLLNAGGFVPDNPDQDPPPDCNQNPGACSFDFSEAGKEAHPGLDPGFYYVQGGTIEHDGISLQIGFRYTF